MKIEKDKWKHFYVGIALGILFYTASIFYWPKDYSTAIIVSLAALYIICYGFELFSLATGLGHYEVMDAIAGMIGGVIGMLAAILFFCFF